MDNDNKKIDIEEVVENTKNTTDEIKNEVQTSSEKKGIFTLVVIIAVIAIIAIIGYFVFNKNKTKSGIVNTDLSSIIGKIDPNKITFETITNQYLKVMNKGMIENGGGSIRVKANNFGSEKEEKVTGVFADDIKYSSKADLKSRKIEVNFNNIVSLDSKKIKKTPAMDVKNLPFDFQILVDNTKIYFKLNTDINKILSSPGSNDQTKQIIKEISSKYLGKYFVLDMEKIPGVTEEDKNNFAFDILNEIKKQTQIFNNYNKQYNAFLLKSTGKTEKINGVNTTKFEVKTGEAKNVVKFFQAIILDIQIQQIEERSSYASQQKKSIKEEWGKINSQVDTFFAGSKNSKAIDNIIKENVDSVVYVWVSENGLPVKSSFKLNIKDAAKMLNQIQDLMPETEGEKIKFVGNLKIDINFTEEVGYNQKINIEYPKDAIDLIELSINLVKKFLNDSAHEQEVPNVPGLPLEKDLEELPSGLTDERK